MSGRTAAPSAEQKKIAAASVPRLVGVVRLGRRTKALTPLLSARALVVLDHPDLDTVAARALLARKPLAIINCRPFVTGRYPNRGPGVLLTAGVPLFESSEDLFALLRDNERAVVFADDTLRREDGTPVSALRPLTTTVLAARLEQARANLDEEITRFAENTLRYLGRKEERALLLDAVAVPEITTMIAGRPALVVVRGETFEDDLSRLGRYLHEQKPVVIAVDGAADTLLASGVRPDLILGDMDSVGDNALRCGAEIIVHARPGGEAPGLARVQALGVPAKTFPVAGTSEDAALLLAWEKNADLIVAVGTHTNLEDFLDKGRGGMASTFLVRLKVGSRLVDARGVSRLYKGREKLAPLLGFLVVSALFPLGVLLWSTPQGQVAWRAVVLWFRLLLR